MTVTYNGTYSYLLEIGKRKLTLSMEEINHIQSYNFISMMHTESVEELEDRIEDLEMDIGEYQNIIDDLTAELQEERN